MLHLAVLVEEEAFFGAEGGRSHHNRQRQRHDQCVGPGIVSTERVQQLRETLTRADVFMSARARRATIRFRHSLDFQSECASLLPPDVWNLNKEVRRWFTTR